jgi:hypothetical protein
MCNVSICCRRWVTGNSIAYQHLNSVNTNATIAAHVPAPLMQQQLRCTSADIHITSGSTSILTDELASLSMTEQEILHSLVEGRGITQYDSMGLLESCGSCQQTFAVSALWAHIPICSESWSQICIY